MAQVNSKGNMSFQKEKGSNSVKTEHIQGRTLLGCAEKPPNLFLMEALAEQSTGGE